MPAPPTEFCSFFPTDDDKVDDAPVAKSQKKSTAKGWGVRQTASYNGKKGGGGPGETDKPADHLFYSGHRPPTSNQPTPLLPQETH